MGRLSATPMSRYIRRCVHRCAASCIQTGKASSRREFTYISGCAARAYGIARLDGLQKLRAQLLRDGGVGLPDLCQLLHNFSSKLHRPHDLLQSLYMSLLLQEVCDFGNAQQEELSALQAATSWTFVAPARRPAALQTLQESCLTFRNAACCIKLASNSH